MKKNNYNDGFTKNEIKDVAWKSVDEGDSNNIGGIKFRKNTRKSKFKSFIKIIVFILIASICGGITAYFVSKKMYPKNIYKPSDKSIFEQKENINNSETKLPKNVVTKVAESVSPAVVGINRSGEDFFGQESIQGSGSGIIFKSDGYIVTNYHVIKDSKDLKVQLTDGSEPLDAKVIGYDKRSDLAVIKVNAENLPVAKFGDSSKIKVGDVAIAIGNPLGEKFAGTVTAGIISAVDRNIKIPDPDTREITTYKVLQTDAAINPGNSGGALCNEAGEVIGINSLKLGGQNNVEGMGFAISINEATKVIDSIMKYGHVSNPYLGIYGRTVISENKKVKGVYVQEIVKGTGAEKAGIRPTDIIVELDNKTVTKFEDLSDIIDKHKVGDTISCKILRNGKILELKVQLSEMKN